MQEFKTVDFQIYEIKHGEDCHKLNDYFEWGSRDPNFEILTTSMTTYFNENGEYVDRILIGFTYTIVAIGE